MIKVTLNTFYIITLGNKTIHNKYHQQRNKNQLFEIKLAAADTSSF